ncbi:MAG: dienelactone hydrolase family protein [Ignavibacteriae bacterium]|nr:MAG: dienelactone hydrolase family protein [Ignavibacteriota bacterium]
MKKTVQILLCVVPFFLTVLFAQEKISTPGNSLPPGEGNAPAVLKASPRHGEWIDVPYDNSSVPLRAWIVYPERKGKAPVVIIIHEIFGLSDWIRSVADQLARDGFIAVAPDYLSGFGPDGGGTESIASRDSVVRLIRLLSPEESYKRTNAVFEYAATIPSANGNCATLGFCWGGGRSFGYACMQPKLKAAVVYYGTSPDAKELASLSAPVLGLYGAEDARVVSTVEPAYSEIKKRGRQYEYEIYEGAGHGFLRQQNGRDGANLRASEKAWLRTVEFLRKHL